MFIIKYLRTFGFDINDNLLVKQEEIAKQINKSLRTVKTKLVQMQYKGLITRKNGKRNSEWIVL